MDIKLDGLSVMVGMPAGRDIPALTVKSLLDTFSLCHKMEITCKLGMVSGSAVVQWARDEVVAMFLQSDVNRLFWIDSDMVWTPEQFMRMLALSQLRSVVCATYPAKTEPVTFYVNNIDNDVTTDELGLMSIYGVGLGFTVMQRGVIEELAAKAPQVRDEISGRSNAAIFRVGSVDGKREGEDMAFFRDVRELGHKVWLDPEINLGHIGQKMYTGAVLDAMRKSE